jgi:hypothetical protein
MKKILLATVIALSSASAFAGSVDMTCAQAQNYYNTHGRITVRTGSGDLVPIYGLVNRNACQGHYTASPYWVRATDDATCVLGYRCYDNGR